MIGVNKHSTGEHVYPPLLQISEELEEEKIVRTIEVRRTRDNRKAIQSLNALRAACKTDKNMMPYVLEAVKAYATEQEICDVWRGVFGEYRESSVHL